MGKITKTYSIDEIVYDAFDLLSNEKHINKSSFIEKSIKNLLKENGQDFIDLIGKVFVSRLDENLTVSVISQDFNCYCLHDGSKINKILFHHVFKELDPVDPDKFFDDHNKVIENIVNEVKKIE